MPTIAGGGKLRGPRRRTMCNNVSLLTATLSRRDREAAGLPPSAIARQCTTSSSRFVSGKQTPSLLSRSRSRRRLSSRSQPRIRGTSSETVKSGHRPDPLAESEPNRRLEFIKSGSDPILDADAPLQGVTFPRRITVWALPAFFAAAVPEYLSNYVPRP